MSPTSVNTRAILYVTSLKTSGALGSAPVIMNLSFGGPTPKPLMRAAIDYAIARGVVVVAAAGNLGDAGMAYPAGYPEVISTGAVGWTLQFPVDDPTEVWWILRDVPEANPLEFLVANFSSRELPGQDLDLIAPGFVVPAAYTRAGQADYTFAVGTSHACPHVAGVAALMLQKNPGLTQAQIEAILEATAMPLAPGCATSNDPVIDPGNEPTWSDHGNVYYLPTTHCWSTNATGHGLLDAGAALGATPFP